MKELLDTGMQRKVIAARLGLHPDTVARYADATIDDLLVSKSRAGKLDPFKDYLDARWNAGCTDAERLTAELRAQGYQGTARTVRRYLEPVRESGSPPATPRPHPSPSRLPAGSPATPTRSAR